jgi:hypothetical protein
VAAGWRPQAANKPTFELDVKLAVDELIALQDFPQSTPAMLIFLLWMPFAVRQGVIVVRLLQSRSSTSSSMGY